MPETITQAPATNDTNVKYAGFWIRFLASIIDVILISIVSFLFLGWPEADNTPSEIAQVLQTIFGVVYQVVFWVWKGATPGKMAVGIKIIDENGNIPSIKTAVIRYIGYILSTLPFLLGYIWIGFDKEKRGWHDMIAKTHVVHAK